MSLRAQLDLLGAERDGSRIRCFGDVRAEAEALARTCGLVPRDDRVVYRVSGADRIDYLHRMLTQDVASLQTGAAADACLLNVRGRILGDLRIWNRADDLLLELPAVACSIVIAVLEKYVIADDVTFEDAAARWERLTLVGPTAGDVVPALALEVPTSGRFAPTADGTVLVLRHDLGDRRAFELLASTEGADRCVQTLVESGAVLSGHDAFEIARVESGVAAFGSELGDDVLLNEAGLERAVSWTKGCYPGQEPVVMARHRGHPPRLLARLAIDGGVRPERGAVLLADGKPAGTLTSVVDGAAASGLRALGYVRHAHALAGAVLEIEGGGKARITDLGSA